MSIKQKECADPLVIKFFIPLPPHGRPTDAPQTPRLAWRPRWSRRRHRRPNGRRATGAGLASLPGSHEAPLLQGVVEGCGEHRRRHRHEGPGQEQRASLEAKASGRRRPAATGGDWRRLEATGGDWRRLEATGGDWRRLEATGGTG